jgi:hypothetical protein
VRGWYHPRGPEDVPLEVSDWLGPVAACLGEIDAEESRKAWAAR